MEVISALAGAKHLKQDMEAREEAAIKAANCYLNKDKKDLDIQSKTLFDNLTKEKFASASQHSINASYKLVNSMDQACYMSTFNANKQQEWQTAMPLHFATLEKCQRTMICDQSMSTNSSTTPIAYLKAKRLKSIESDKQQHNTSGQVDSKTIEFPLMMERKKTLKYAEEINFLEGCLDSTKLLKWEGGLPLSSKNCATTTAKQQPRTMDIEQYPFSTMDELLKKSSTIRDIFSIQMSPSRATCIWQNLRVYNPNVPISKSQNCTQKLVRRASYGSLCLEDGMRQLSNEDLLLALENPRKIHVTLKSLSSKEQFDASCGEQRPFKYGPYLPPKKCVINPWKLKGSLDGKDESIANPAILTSFEQDYEEASNQRSPQGLEFQCYLQNSNPIEKSELSHFDSSTHLQCCNAKFRGTKDKDNKSPAWMHSLNVRKPTKWRATSTSHTRLQPSPASQREQLALRHDRSKDTTSLASVVDSNFKGRAENNFFDNNNDATTTTVAATRQARIASGFAEIAEPATSSSELTVFSEPKDENHLLHLAGVNPSFARCSEDSYLNGWIHGGSVDLAKRTSFSGVLTTAAQENRCVTDSLFGQDDSRFFHHVPENSTFSSNLDYLISEVVYEWVESCGASLPASSACDGSQEDRASKSMPGDFDLVTDVRKTSVAALASVVQPLLAALQETQIEESIVKEFEADETICLLLEKLQFYETKIRALKNRRKNNF